MTDVLSSPKGLSKGKAYLEPAEVDLLERSAVTTVRDRTGQKQEPCLRDQLLIRLLFRCGIRVSEAVSLGVEDVDTRAGTVRILHLKERLRLFCPGCGVRMGRSHRFCPGCGKEVAEAVRRLQETRRQRVLPLDRGTAQMLREYIAGGGPVLRRGRLLLFGMSRFRAWQVVRDAARRAGLGPLVNPESGRERGVSPHRLRDGFAVNALKHDDSGEGMRLLQEMLGHTSFNTTARYRKVSGDDLQQWHRRLWGEKQ